MSEATLFEYLFVLYKRRLSILAVTVASALTAVVLSYVMSPVYEARAVFFVPATTTGLSEFVDEQSKTSALSSLVPPTDEASMAPYFGLLKSRKIAELVHLDYPQKRVEKLLLSDMSFELTNELLITLFSRDRDPELAANIANAYVHHLNKILEAPAREAIKSDMAVLGHTIEGTTQQLQQARQRQVELEANYSIVLLDEEIRSLTGGVNAVSTRRDSVQAKLVEVETRLRRLADEMRNASVTVPSGPAGLSSDRVEGLLQELTDLEASIARSEVIRDMEDGDIVALRRQREGIWESLNAEFGSLTAAMTETNVSIDEQLRQKVIDSNVEKVRLKASSVARAMLLDELSDRLTSLIDVKIEFAGLTEEVERLQSRYNTLTTELQKAELEGAWSLHAVVPVDVAKPPETPVFPVPGVNLVVAVVSGLLFGIVYAFSVEGLAKGARVRRRAIIKNILETQ
jgi:uncharacterized protein involved in exopolysaccharide biosynthesis